MPVSPLRTIVPVVSGAIIDLWMMVMIIVTVV